MNDGDTKYLDYLPIIAESDAEALLEAQKNYGNSWKARGGVGAFFVLSRKWDRLENVVSKDIYKEGVANVRAYDIFGHIDNDRREEGFIDDIRDLRRYLMLVEAEMVARGAILLSPEDSAIIPVTESDLDKLDSLVNDSKTEHPAPFGFDEEQDT